MLERKIKIRNRTYLTAVSYLKVVNWDIDSNFNRLISTIALIKSPLSMILVGWKHVKKDTHQFISQLFYITG